jgi:hypothetical protein
MCWTATLIDPALDKTGDASGSRICCPLSGWSPRKEVKWFRTLLAPDSFRFVEAWTPGHDRRYYTTGEYKAKMHDPDICNLPITDGRSACIANSSLRYTNRHLSRLPGFCEHVAFPRLCRFAWLWGLGQRGKGVRRRTPFSASSARIASLIAPGLFQGAGAIIEPPRMAKSGQRDSCVDQCTFQPRHLVKSQF